MNLPNSLTVLRMVLVPFFIGFLLNGSFGWALLTLLIAGATDILDGIVARIADQRTKLGSYLDPLADKLLLTSAFITLAILHKVPVWAAVIVLGRDLVMAAGILLLYLMETPIEVVPTLIGKAATLTQLCYLAFALVIIYLQRDLQPLLPLLAVMLVLTVASGLQYIYRGIRAYHPNLV